MSPSAAPPSPQEIQRKLSLHTPAKPAKSITSPGAAFSGNESDSDSFVASDITLGVGQHSIASAQAGTSAQPPLSSIAERRLGSGNEDSEDEEEEEEEGGWKTADVKGKPRDSADESVIKSGYLWKKGERRKTWKKRWFVLRPAHLAYYKSSAEYQLLRLLELSDVHSCTQVALKRHENAFGLVSPVRTFYLQAKTPGDVRDWVAAIQEAREVLKATSTQTSVSTPIAIPSKEHVPQSSTFTPSPPSHVSHSMITSSDSEDAAPITQRTLSNSSQNRPVVSISPTKAATFAVQDPGKVILSGYLMKCGSKRRNWRKRWFVLTGEKLVYSASHMDTRPHRQFPFSDILDALEYDLPKSQHHISPPMSPPVAVPSSEIDDIHNTHTFKIVTTKRSLLLCAPTEEDEIKWLGAVRALIARRSESGMVPGASKSATSGHPSDGIAGGSGGLKSKTRTLSVSGPSGGSVPQESAQVK